MNAKDAQAVAVRKSTVVVGHVPTSLSVLFFQFLFKTCKKATVEVTGAVVNRGAGYGMEVTCKCRLYGPKTYVECVQKVMDENSLS